MGRGSAFHNLQRRCSRSAYGIGGASAYPPVAEALTVGEPPRLSRPRLAWGPSLVLNRSQDRRALDVALPPVFGLSNNGGATVHT